MRNIVLPLATLLVFGIACVDPIPTPKKQGNNTTNMDGGTAALDSGIIPDAGPGPQQTLCGEITPGVSTNPICCPVDGKGCDGNTCFFQGGTINAPQCRDLAGAPVAQGQACNSSLNDCEAGFTCAQIRDDTEARCHKVCSWPNNDHCAGIQDPMTGLDYKCLFNFASNQAWGLCEPAPVGGDCVPYNDMCPQGQHCEIISNAGEKGCVDDGPTAIGGNCSSGAACMRGGICVNLDGAAKCYEPCDPANVMSCSDPMARCGGELSSGGMGFGFGVCGKSSCSPLTPDIDCAMGENCELAGSALSCQPEGTATAGQACSGASGFCARGNICIALSGTAGPVCYEVCDAATPNCSAGVCRGLQGFDMSWGICN